MDIYTIKAGIDNCYVIKDKKAVIIDGGMPGKFDDFCKGIKKFNIDVKQISALILTHCHWDHIGCACKIKEMTGAKMIVHKNESNILKKGELVMPPAITKWGKIFGALINRMGSKVVLEPCDVDIEIDDNFPLKEFGINGKIIFTPGHSPGSISVALNTGELFAGCLAMNRFPMTIGPDLPIFAADVQALKQSWRRVIDLGVKTIYPAHGMPFPVEKIIVKIKKIKAN